MQIPAKYGKIRNPAQPNRTVKTEAMNTDPQPDVCEIEQAEAPPIAIAGKKGKVIGRLFFEEALGACLS